MQHKVQVVFATDFVVVVVVVVVAVVVFLMYFRYGIYCLDFVHVFVMCLTLLYVVEKTNVRLYLHRNLTFVPLSSLSNKFFAVSVVVF